MIWAIALPLIYFVGVMIAARSLYWKMRGDSDADIVVVFGSILWPLALPVLLVIAFVRIEPGFTRRALRRTRNRRLT